MSMQQIDPSLRPCPLASSYANEAPQWIYHFMYDQYYCWEIFQVFCPNAVPLGVAWLRGWTWHINTDGKANIRRTFYNGKEASQDVITNGTYGFVFRVTKEDDEKLHAIYGVDRVRIVQYVQIKTPGLPNGISAVSAMTYWDPKNTHDGSNKAKFLGNKTEQYKWSQGIMRLKTAGVPHWYIERILEIILGLFMDKDPIYVNPRDLFYTPPRSSQRPAPPQNENAQRRPRRQTMIKNAEEAISANTQFSPNQATSNAQRQATAPPQSIAADPHSAARPQVAATPKSNAASADPNIKFAKKRKSESGDGEGQPATKKKPAPGPSNLRSSTLA